MTVAPLPSGGLLPLEATTLALLYRRVSKEEMDDDGRVSLQTQDADGRHYVDRLPRTRLLAVFTDKESGRKDSRRDYQKMLAQVRAEVACGRRVIVVVAHLARFGRRMAERVRAWEELKALGVEIHSVREGGLVTELMYNVMSSFAQEEVRLLSERITRSNRAYREAGWLRPGGCRWGYRWRPASETEIQSGSPSVVLDEDEQTGPFVRELFERAAAGASINSLARWTSRLPATARGTGQLGAPRVLSFAGVRQILRAPVYVARHGTYGEDVLERPVGNWTQLVTDEQWAAIHGTSRLHRSRARADGQYPLTGLLWCSQCRGYRMGGRTIKPRLRGARLAALRREYTCTGHIYGSHCQMVVPAQLVERALTETLRRIFDELALPGTIERARQIAERDAATEQRRHGGTRIGALRADLTKAENLLTESWIQSTDGTLTPTAYAAIQARLSPRVDDLKAQIADLEQATPRPEVRIETAAIEMVLVAAPAWTDALTDAADDPEGRRAIGDAARVLIEKVWAVRERRGVYRLEVLYTAAGMQVLKYLAASERAAWVESYHSANALYQLAT